MAIKLSTNLVLELVAPGRRVEQPGTPRILRDEPDRFPGFDAVLVQYSTVL